MTGKVQQLQAYRQALALALLGLSHLLDGPCVNGTHVSLFSLHLILAQYSWRPGTDYCHSGSRSLLNILSACSSGHCHAGFKHCSSVDLRGSLELQGDQQVAMEQRRLIVCALKCCCIGNWALDITFMLYAQQTGRLDSGEATQASQACDYCKCFAELISWHPS